MKLLITLGTLLITQASFAQPDDSFQAFRDAKRDIPLATGINMRYIETGRENGETLILLHGLTDTSRSFKTTIDALSDLNSTLRIIAPDLRGHGESSMPETARCAADPATCFSPADMAADIVALMDEKRIRSAYVLGHSMGSIVAQELALRYPSRVTKLILIGSFASGRSNAALHEFLKPMFLEAWKSDLLQRNPKFEWPGDAYTMTPAMLGKEVSAFIRKNWVTELGVNEAFLQDIFRETVQTPLGTWIGAINALSALDNRQALEQLSVPTLCLWAIQDMAFPDQDQAILKAALQAAVRNNNISVFYKVYGKKPLPASRLQENDLGHNLHWAAPTEIARDIVLFINEGKPVANLPYWDETKGYCVDEKDANIVLLTSQ